VAAHRKTALSVRITGTGSMVPERPVTTTELVAQVPGTWDAARVLARTGIAARHFVAPGTWIPWLGLGPLGPHPLSPPFPPVRMRQLVGAPIDPRSDGRISLDARPDPDLEDAEPAAVTGGPETAEGETRHVAIAGGALADPLQRGKERTRDRVVQGANQS
jgi:hypothetical protein